MAEKRTARILVVDDDPILLELLADTLLAIGYETTPATDGIIALDILATQKFDLVITDIKMPRMNGLELLKKIKRHYPGIPVLFITGVATNEVIGQAEVDGFLTKPFRIAHIEELIEKALSSAGGRPVKRKTEILLIDLAGRIDETLTDSLFSQGFTLFSFRDLEEGLRELANNRFAAILADFSPWLANPADILRRIRKQAPQTPILVNADAYPPDRSQEAVDEFQLTALIAAPYTAAAVLEALRGHLTVGTE